MWLQHWFFFFLSIEWNSIRLSGPAQGIVTKTVHKNSARGWWGLGGGGGQCVGDGGGKGVGVVGVRGVGVMRVRG